MYHTKKIFVVGYAIIVSLLLAIAGGGLFYLFQHNLVQDFFPIIAIVVSTIAAVVSIGVFSFKKISITEDVLYNDKERAETTLHSINEAVVTTSLNGTIQYINTSASNMVGLSRDDCFQRSVSDILKLHDENSEEPVELPTAVIVRGKTIQMAEIVLTDSKQRTSSVELSGAPIKNREGVVTGAVWVIRDVTESHELSKQLSFQARHDSLTGLVNRSEFEHQLKQLLRDAKANKQCHAILFMDLDQFKIVNDTCGHMAGDKLLKDLTHQLQARIRSTDTLARLGGDEFGVLLRTCSIDKAFQVANQLRQVVQDFRFIWEEKSFLVTISIGIVSVTESSDNIANLLSAADTAMYTAKDKGRNRIVVFEGDDTEAMKKHGEMQWVTRITQAYEQDRFQLFFQPIVPVQQNNKNIHHEILLRMLDDENNIVPPMAFIPAAERYNLMPTIDRWVVKSLFTFIAAHREMLDPTKHTFTVNLSGSSINDDTFLSFIHDQFKQHNIEPKQICFEVTETVAIANLTNAATFIKDLKQIGCQFALDDFGSGLSSFGYLKSLPIDVLKIDGSFVKDLTSDPIDRAMVASINQVGHTMQLETIAEFVENAEILKILEEIGVDYAQGYHIAKPTPLNINDVLKY